MDHEHLSQSQPTSSRPARSPKEVKNSNYYLGIPNTFVATTRGTLVRAFIPPPDGPVHNPGPITNPPNPPQNTNLQPIDPQLFSNSPMNPPTGYTAPQHEPDVMYMTDEQLWQEIEDLERLIEAGERDEDDQRFLDLITEDEVRAESPAESP